MSSVKERTNCPVCTKQFSIDEIEHHVNRCLFLCSEQSTSTNLNERSSPLLKKRKSFPNASVGNRENEEDSLKLQKEFASKNGSPLSEKMRPCELSDYIGQDHVMGENKLLRNLIDSGNIPSMILWGPPGCGKTTLAHIIEKRCKKTSSTRFIKLSATMAGVNDVKEIIKIAKNDLINFKRRTILFMDEIHRFNKLQQDIFLPQVESGTIILIGATTENPSFSLNSALLSRCRVIVLEQHRPENLLKILKSALRKLDVHVAGSGMEIKLDEKELSRYVIDEETVQWLADICDGDARIALNSLELALRSGDSDSSSVVHITHDMIKEGIMRSHVLYDRKGDEHYNMISAVHKSIRASEDNAALYWVTRMLEGGEDPIFIARRLVRAASEDIGLADPMAVTCAVSTMQGCQLLGKPECDVLLAQCAVYLARAPKSTEVYRALERAKSTISQHKGPLPSVPIHLRNAPTTLMKKLGYGQQKESSAKCMPDGMENINFF